jgi:hypothetical protein
MMTNSLEALINNAMLSSVEGFVFLVVDSIEFELGRLVSKGYVRPVFLNALRDSVELTDAGRQVLMNELAKVAL